MTDENNNISLRCSRTLQSSCKYVYIRIIIISKIKFRNSKRHLAFYCTHIYLNIKFLTRVIAKSPNSNGRFPSYHYLHNHYYNIVYNMIFQCTLVEIIYFNEYHNNFSQYYTNTFAAKYRLPYMGIEISPYYYIPINLPFVN